MMMSEYQHNAAVPQEKLMDKSLELSEGKANTSSKVMIDAERFSGVGMGLPEGFGERTQEEADLLERRLSRLEQALGLGAICGH